MTVNKKYKVLIVPILYPEIDNPLLGSFFQEQMSLLKDNFEFKILIGKRIIYRKKTFIKQLLKGKFRYSNRTDYKYKQDEQTISLEYSYVKNLPKYFENIQYSYLNSLFDNIFSEILESEWKPDLIHIQSLSDTSVFVCNVAKKNDIPVLLTEHILFVRRRLDFFQNEIEKVYRRAKKVLCVSNYVYRNLLVNGIQMNDVGIIGNLVDDRFMVNNFTVSKKQKKILFVASHLYDKDILVLLEAIKLLVDFNFTDFTLTILGLEPNLIINETNESLLQMVNDYGIEKYVEVKGKVKRETILSSYSDYSILVSTSFSETFGLGVAEALVHGLPVICTDSGGIRDFVNETNGIIVPIKDSYALAKGIMYLINNLNRYDSVKISSQIVNNFGTDAFRNKLNLEYKKMILLDGK